MTQSPQTFPDQPAANSVAAVGAIFGTMLGLLTALLTGEVSAIGEVITPLQAIVTGILSGTTGGALVGFVSDRLARSR